MDGRSGITAKCPRCKTEFMFGENLHEFPFGTDVVTALQCPKCGLLFPTAAMNDDVRAGLERLHEYSAAGDVDAAHAQLAANRILMREVMSRHLGGLKLHGDVWDLL